MHSERLKLKLAIVVPTLNPNPELLEKALRSIREAVDLHPQVKIFVVDNGSDVLVSSLSTGTISMFDECELVRFEYNLGFSRNLYRAACSVSSEFIWFIGDDDLVQMQQKSLSSIFDELGINRALALNANLFRDGDAPIWSNGVLDESPWAGSAMSSVIFDRTSFLETADEIFRVTEDKIWIHFLAFHVLKAKISSKQKSVSVFPQVAVRLGRIQNWESHFGSQYLAGISCLKSLSELSQSGVYPYFSLIRQVESRFSGNFMDVLTLTSSLGAKEMRRARSDLQAMAKVSSLELPRLSAFVMILPRVLRVCSAFIIRHLGKLKASIAKRLATKKWDHA